MSDETKTSPGCEARGHLWNTYNPEYEMRCATCGAVKAATAKPFWANWNDEQWVRGAYPDVQVVGPDGLGFYRLFSPSLDDELAGIADTPEDLWKDIRRNHMSVAAFERDLRSQWDGSQVFSTQASFTSEAGHTHLVAPPMPVVVPAVQAEAVQGEPEPIDPLYDALRLIEARLVDGDISAALRIIAAHIGLLKPIAMTIAAEDLEDGFEEWNSRRRIPSADRSIVSLVSNERKAAWIAARRGKA